MAGISRGAATRPALPGCRPGGLPFDLEPVRRDSFRDSVEFIRPRFELARMATRWPRWSVPVTGIHCPTTWRYARDMAATNSNADSAELRHSIRLSRRCHGMVVRSLLLEATL